MENEIGAVPLESRRLPAPRAARTGALQEPGGDEIAYQHYRSTEPWIGCRS